MTETPQIDTHWYAWAAGIIDGEGIVTIYRHLPRANHPRGATRPLVAVQSSTPEITDRLMFMFGGSVYPIKARNSNRVPTYRWQVGGPAIVPVLEKVIPWLTIKRAHAELLIAFWAECGLKHGGHKEKFMSDANYARRMEYVDQIRSMQMKGPQGAPGTIQ